jgi:hypothetical protein
MLEIPGMLGKKVLGCCKLSRLEIKQERVWGSLLFVKQNQMSSKMGMDLG